MPSWIDLSAHQAVLNVYQSTAGKVLMLRALTPDHPLPDSVTALGFTKNGDHFVRDNLRFTLSEILTHFPQARSREFSPSEIFFLPTSSSQPVPAANDPVRTELAPWQMTAVQWHVARTALRTTPAASASAEADRIGKLEALAYGVSEWKRARALAGDEDARSTLEEPTTHLDVVRKALAEGHKVPFDVVSEYPELLEPDAAPAAAAQESAFVQARTVALQGPDNPRRIEALIAALVATKGGVPAGAWAERFTFNVAVPDSEDSLLTLMEKHFPSEQEMRQHLRIDAIADREVTSAVDYGSLADQQLQAMQAFESSFERTTGPRLADLRTLAPASEVAAAVVASRGRALDEARSNLERYQARAQAQQESVERMQWEKFEPFQHGPVKKPSPGQIGFTKSWIEQDNGWFQVRHGDRPAWTNGHLFDLSAPHYAGHEKFHSKRLNGKPLGERPDIARFIELDTTVALSPAFVQRGFHKDRDAVLFARPEGAMIGIDKVYYDYLVSKHPTASFSIAAQWGNGVPADTIVQVKVDGVVVAGVMPVRLPAELTLDLVRSKLEQFGARADAPTIAGEAINLDDDEHPGADVHEISFVSTQKAGGRPAATASIRMAIIDGRWYQAVDSAHNQGSHLSRSGPLTSHGPGYDTQFAARFAACRKLAASQVHVIQANDSVTTEKQRAAAREMIRWAEQAALPAHGVEDVQEGPYKGSKRITATGDGLAGLSAHGDTLEAATQLLLDRIEHVLSGAQREWRVIGKNVDGRVIEEDRLGVRSIVERGQRCAETVAMTAFGPVVDLDQRDMRFLTAAELRSERSDRADAAYLPATTSSPMKGEAIAGHVVDALVDGVPVAFERRKVSKYDPRPNLAGKSCTWARAYLDGQWRSLGEPWTHARPSNSELAIAIDFARSNAPAFDGDQVLAELNIQIQAENAGVTDPRHKLPLLDPQVYQLNSVGRDSYELRFKDPAQPFRAAVDYQSPGVYLPSRQGTTTGPKTTLMHALAWAAREITSSKAWFDRTMQEQRSEVPRYDVDGDSFMALFGAPGDNAATLETVRAYCSNPLADPDTPRFRRLDPINLPDTFTLQWNGESTVFLSSLPLEGRFQIALSVPADGEPVRGRLWDAAGALAAATAKIRDETAWALAKAGRDDAGEGLDALAQRQAEFMRAHDPERHSGLVTSMHRNFALALTDKNHQFLIGWLARPKGQNDLSKKFFSQVTGVKLPRTATDIRTAIYGWAGISPADGKRIDEENKRRSEQAYLAREAERRIEDATAALERTLVRHNGVEKSARQFLDDIIEAGFVSLETHKVGAVDRYRLVHREERRSYQVSGNMVDYARNVLKLRAENTLEPELAEPAPALRPS